MNQRLLAGALQYYLVWFAMVFVFEPDECNVIPLLGLLWQVKKTQTMGNPSFRGKTEDFQRKCKTHEVLSFPIQQSSTDETHQPYVIGNPLKTIGTQK